MHWWITETGQMVASVNPATCLDFEGEPRVEFQLKSDPSAA
jgi:hypothetical protein